MEISARSVTAGVGAPSRVRPWRSWEAAGAVVLIAVFLAPLLVDGPWEDEEGPLGIFASQVYYRAIVRGDWLFWLNDLGFGTPMPIGNRLDFHPVFALGSLVSLRVALSAVWLVHVALMVVYFLRLAAVSGIRAPLRLVLLACYLFSVTSVSLFFVTDWLSCIIGWSLYPILVFYLRQALTGEAMARFWWTSARLALLFGFWVLNSHPGYIAPLALALVVYAVVATPFRRRVYACLIVAFLLCLAISAERLYFIASEMQLFPVSVPRQVQPGFTANAYVDAGIAPFSAVRGELRLPFIGLVFGLASLASVLGLHTHRDAHQRACSVAFLSALALSVAPIGWWQWTGASGGWLFRDPMVFFGLLAGGLVLQWGFDHRATFARPLVWVLLAVQVSQQAAVVLVGYREFDDHRGRLAFYRHQGRPAAFASVLVQQAETHGRRLYLSAGVQDIVRGALTPYGIHFVTDLVFLGLNPVNAWFKGVSMDRLFPSPRGMHGYIEGQREVIENGALMDVLGINLVLSTEAEGAVPAGLLPVVRTPVTMTGGHGADLVLLANPDAWPHAVLLNPGARGAQLSLRPGCPHQGALCREYEVLAGMRLSGEVSLADRDGRYTAQFPPADRERLLFLSVMYRAEWEATSSEGALRIDPIAGAFLGVTVPPGVSRVDLAFVPRVRMALAGLSGLTMCVLLAGMAGARWRRRRR